MGETRYPLGEKNVVRFGYEDYRYGCLCTFPYNYKDKKLSIGTVESLALLGAALCLYNNNKKDLTKDKYDDEYVLPDCLPQWIRDEIRQNCGDYPEKYDGYEYLPDCEDEEREKEFLKKRYKEIIAWCEESLKDLEDDNSGK